MHFWENITMAEKNIGKITQIISAVIDIKFAEGNLPEINSRAVVGLRARPAPLQTSQRRNTRSMEKLIRQLELCMIIRNWIPC